MIEIPTDALKAAGRMLKRLRTKHCTLPVLNHILVEANSGEAIRLTVCNLDQWLSTHVPTDRPSDTPEVLLVPTEAFEASLKADKGSSVTFTRKGTKKDRRVRLKMLRGGITVETHHPTLESDEFPPCPQVPENIEATPVPGRTFEMLTEIAGCASKDSTRYILNSVLLTPEDGGMVVATDGRRLAATPASVPDRKLVIPTPAVHALGHPDFQQGVIQVTPFHRPETTTETDGKAQGKPGDPDHVRIEAGGHVLVTRLIDGHYPNWKQVVPTDRVASASFEESHRPAVIDWLKALSKGGKEASVILRPGKRGHLELAHAPDTSHASRIEVPAEITGKPQPVALNAAYLADALTIAPTLWFIDEMSPVVARRLDGTLCVVMPIRIDVAACAA
ncbi:hypothetical protein [Haloferula sp. A504]|uniref:hypothetical protein n=1 Tax=Haloferula sp. A504 TaxID=3373601 RepID=UPI0031BBE79F|nr:DNA polymerase III subunit beta [Verrucomicrobiaceae bacterium E54]